MMTETLVRSLSPLELAERLQDSDDFATKTLAKHVINGDFDGASYEELNASLERDLDKATEKAEGLEEANETLILDVEQVKELLQQCLDDGVADEDLKNEINSALR